MTRSTLKHITTLAAGLLLSGAAFSAVRAQDEAPPPPMPQGGPFAGPGDPNAPQGGPFGGGGGGGRRGGQFGGGGQFPGAGNVALGTVSSVDAAGGKITLNGRGGQTQTVQVSPATTIEEQVAGTIADLKVGDTVRVSGVPTALTAAQISTVPAGGANGGVQPPNPFGGNAARPGGGQFGGGGQGGFGRPGGGQSTVTAKVATLSPLTLKMDDGTTVAVKADSTTKVTRTITVGLSALKTGDQIVATGQTDANNQFTATALRVNMGGGGGFGGGRFGQGGFGRGQFGGGQGGGFGGNGGRGGNRRRGGQGGNGQGGPPPPDPDGQVGAGGGNTDVLLNGE